MTFKDQLGKLKENWLIIALVVLVALFLFSGSLSPSRLLSSASTTLSYDGAGYAEQSYARGGYAPAPSAPGFAPGVEERKVIKTASMTVETSRDDFGAKEQQLKSIIQST